MGRAGGEGCTPRPPIRAQPASERRVVAVVFLGLVLDLLAFTLLLPLLPRLLESFGRAQDPLYGSWQRGVDWFATAIGMPPEKRYNSVLFGGVVGSGFSLLQFLVAPLTGAASDRLGRRPVMLLALLGLATSYAVWAASQSFAAFLASRVIGGISKGNVSLSTAIVADLGSPAARSRGMAVIGVAFSLGFTLGPLLGASVPMDAAPWLALLFAVSDLLFIFCFLPETLPPEKRAPSITLGVRAASDLLSPLALLRFSAVAHGQDAPTGDRLRTLRGLGLVYFLYLLLFSGLEYTLSFLVHQRFQFSRWVRSPASAGPPGHPLYRPWEPVPRAQPGGPSVRACACSRRVRACPGPCVCVSCPRGTRTPSPQLAAGEDVFLHRPHHGGRPGRLRPAPEAGPGARSCEAGHRAAGARLPPGRLGALAARTGPGAAALLLRGRRRGALPVRRGRRLWRGRAEGHCHGHAAQPGCPGQGLGATCSCLRVLAGRGPHLLLRGRRALPGPLPSPADPEAATAQGRVAEPSPAPTPRACGGGRLGRLPPPQDSPCPAGPPAWARPFCLRPCTALSSTPSRGAQGLPGFAFVFTPGPRSAG
ncbi:major facilitator superfamily domain-containing protein 10 isoform X1 [Choloepus didactylus]|uniref:major facilitator superfamily domain-containing protein 10 isoform X1 n=1 Tax=Choloepus didactylus TaxID=27675 RepID=UPI00189E186C|nr:major facilitator superfamily domain-containing protein 10 isoform X1 [Choloepus didactylus]